ncbi:MAG: DUF362 domain-containing protein [Candidatus Eisenbacteria bacterium]|nr:DUF362 domain-containing protein [Candidatus Eisenbacteria bacterium]
MPGTSRRLFLKQAAIAAGALAVAPWGSLLRRAQAAPVPADLAIAHWSGDPVSGADLQAAAERLTTEALEALGGMTRFLSKGDVVWIKPNIGWNRPPEMAATTNPDVVAALVRMCLDAGAKKVKVGDNTCHQAKQCYRSSGIADAAEAAGAEVVFLDERRYRDMDLGGVRLQTWPVYPEIVEADLVINVPIAKHHGLSRATLAMKNYMGVVGGQRNAWHQDLPNCLSDITAFMQPRLTVLDAVRVLTNHGPQGGSLDDVEQKNVVAAGTDIVALDAFGAELLGHEPRRIRTIPAAEERGLGTADYRSLAVKELAIA